MDPPSEKSKGLHGIAAPFDDREHKDLFRYKSRLAEKLDLVILEDNTVLNTSGRLPVKGAKFKRAALQLMPEAQGENKTAENKPGEGPRAEAIPRPGD